MNSIRPAARGEALEDEVPPCRGDNDGDGVFRLADAVKTAKLWSSLNRRRRATANELSAVTSRDAPSREFSEVCGACDPR